MKKSILALAVVCAASILRADLILCWSMPDTSATSAMAWYGQPVTIANATALDGTPYGAVAGAKVGYFTADPGTITRETIEGNSSYAMAYDFDEMGASADTVSSVVSPSGRGYAVLDSDTYYYYIALFNDTGDLVAYSQTFQSAGVTNYTFDDEGWIFSASLYTGSGYAVPEPTSGLLVLLGMAGLALRRRKIA